MRKQWRTGFNAGLAGLLALLAMNAEAQEPNFGRAVVLTERDLLIGQPVNWYGPGVVYHYRLDGVGRWREQARLVASDSARMDDFGRALAQDGNTLLVGAPRKRAGSGVAYVFTRASTAAGWRQVAIIEPPTEGDHTEFASSMSLAGNDMLIGAPAVDSTGVLYHYRRERGERLDRRGGTRHPAHAGIRRARRGEWPDTRPGRAARRVRDPDARCLHPRLRRAYRPRTAGAPDSCTEGGMTFRVADPE